MYGVPPTTRFPFGAIPARACRAEHVVEDDDVSPVHLGAPVRRLRHEAGRDLALFRVLDVVLRLVAFLGHLPGGVADQAVVGHEQEFAGQPDLLGARAGPERKLHGPGRVRNGSHSTQRAEELQNRCRTPATRISQGASDDGRQAFPQAAAPDAIAGLAAVPAPVSSPETRAPKRSRGDATAKSLGYVADAKKADAKANPNYKAGQHCANCMQYSGKAGAAAGPCAIFAGKDVQAAGWCKVWVLKPGAKVG